MPTACAQLAPGVTVEDGHVVDSVRGRSWPVNETGRIILEALPASVEEVGASLARRTGRPPADAARHARQFLSLLNSRLLVNLPGNELSRLRTLLIVTLPTLLTGRVVPAERVVRRRTALDTRTAGTVLRGVTVGLALPALRLGLLAALSIAFVLAGLGVHDLQAPLVLGLGLGAGVLVHEAGHALALVGTPAALGVKGMRPFVLHPPHAERQRALRTAVAGPAAGLLVGALLLVPAELLSSASLALIALLTASQGVGLTCLASDGRRACLAT